MRTSTQGVISEEELAPANTEKAERHGKESIVLSQSGEYIPLWSSTPQDLAPAGVGVEMYFVFLKQMILLFFVLSLFVIPCIYFNSEGGQLSQKAKNGYFQTTTVANKISLPLNVTSKEAADVALGDSNKVTNWIIGIDAIICGVFAIMVLGFTVYNEYRIQRSNQNTLRTSLFAVEVSGLPAKDITEEELKAYFEQAYGPVTECSLARGFTELLYIYQDIVMTEREIKKEEARCSINKRQGSDYLKKFQLKKAELEAKLKEKLEASLGGAEKPDVQKAYIIFDKLGDKVKCLKSYKRCGLIDTGVTYKDHALTLSQPTEPSDIVWDNMGSTLKGKIIRAIISIIATTIILIGSFAAIYTASYYASLLPTETDCLKFPETSFQDMLKVTEKIRIYCYCADLGIVIFYLLLTHFQSTASSGKYSKLCKLYTEQYYESKVIIILAMVTVAVVNSVMRFAYLFISKFSKFSSKTAEELSKFLKFFISACLNMILLVLVINLNFQDAQFFQAIYDHFPGGKYLFSGKFPEFNRAWYVSVGESIAMLMFIQIFWPQLMDVIVWVPLNFLWRHVFKRKAVIQADLNPLYEGTRFELWDRYAYILANVFLGLTFSTGVPVLILCLLAYFIVRYWVDKILCILLVTIISNSAAVLQEAYSVWSRNQQKSVSNFALCNYIASYNNDFHVHVYRDIP
eukprot:TRINITY_DN88247_c1_g1_i1.p1 TRINITY_DN88247_c1_g1~~TRINITY_DN88247_c1_g1_i1.p1  ORF type:complete len:687 (-),score=65.51 TRINITY_DN88247_c1_g1_i1:1540-3600(-)